MHPSARIIEHQGKSIYLQHVVQPSSAKAMLKAQNGKQNAEAIARQMADLGNVDFYVSCRESGPSQMCCVVGWDLRDNNFVRFSNVIVEAVQRTHAYLFGVSAAQRGELLSPSPLPGNALGLRVVANMSPRTQAAPPPPPPPPPGGPLLEFLRFTLRCCVQITHWLYAPFRYFQN